MSGHAKANGQKEWSSKKVFTTGEAAEVCKVSQQTIIRCFDSGRLQGFRVPGSRFRRIPRDELIRFMRENEIPVDVLDDANRNKRVLVVDDDPQIVELFVDALKRDKRFDVETAATGYDAGMLTESFRPDIILLDYMLPDINGDVVCDRVRNNSKTANTIIMFVSGVVEPQEVERLKAAGADEFVKKPFEIAQVIERIAELVGA